MKIIFIIFGILLILFCCNKIFKYFRTRKHSKIYEKEQKEYYEKEQRVSDEISDFITKKYPNISGEDIAKTICQFKIYKILTGIEKWKTE